MTFRHGKNTVVLINSVDISPYTNTTDFSDGVDTHDVTCYGAVRKARSTGLGDGKATIGGVADDGAAGPRAVIKPLMAAGAVVTFVLRPYGTGSGKAQSSVGVVIKSYSESLPVADMIKWTAELEMSGALDETPQV